MDWLDELARKTRRNLEQEAARETVFLEKSRLKAALGRIFFAQLEQWLRESAVRFNSRMGSELCAVEDGETDSFTVVSHPRPGLTWTRRIAYEPTAHRILIEETPGSREWFVLDLDDSGNELHALRGGQKSGERPLTAEALGMRILESAVSIKG